VAVDCGTSSAAEIARLTADGIDVIVLDHHVLKEAPPRCVALVNPKLGSEAHELCSAGIVFKVAHALLKRRPCPGLDLREYLDLVALGTVADVVPLAAENRILVKRGLVQIAQSRWPGVRALVAVSGAKPPFSAGDVGFKLGPRLNAAGRLGTAQDALDLLLTDDPARAQTLAEALDRQNRERRAVEETVHAEAEEQIAAGFDPVRDAAVVVGAQGWHAGVVGIVASRLMRRYHRPTLVAGFDENGVGKGSGRSIPGFSLVAALQACCGPLSRHGGHEMAAGFALEWPRFEEFRTAFLAHAAATLGPEQLRPRLHLDGLLTLRQIDFDLLRHHDALQPFGTGNLQPLFMARGLRLVAEPKVLKEKHLSVRLAQDGHVVRAIWFGGAAEELPPSPWDVAFRVERNEYDGHVQPQLEIRAVRPQGG
jgi:single-stranded-DNA-specific exonuclease